MAMQAISVSIEIEIPQLDDSVCPVRQAQIFQQPCDCPNVNGDGRRKLDGLYPDISAHHEPRVEKGNHGHARQQREVNPAGYGKDSATAIELPEEPPKCVELRIRHCGGCSHLFDPGLTVRCLRVRSIHIKEQLSLHYRTNDPKNNETDGPKEKCEQQTWNHQKVGNSKALSLS